jgi:hypothetical protein
MLNLSMALLVAVFTAAFIAIWYYNYVRYQNARKQARHYRLFARAVDDIRGRTDIPEVVRDYIERLVAMPTDEHVVRRYLINALLGREGSMSGEVKKEVELFLGALMATNQSAREQIELLIVHHLFAMTYVDIFSGYLYRRLIVRWLTNHTRAEVAVESVFRPRPYRAAAA